MFNHFLLKPTPKPEAVGYAHLKFDYGFPHMRNVNAEHISLKGRELEDEESDFLHQCNITSVHVDWFRPVFRKSVAPFVWAVLILSLAVLMLLRNRQIYDLPFFTLDETLFVISLVGFCALTWSVRFVWFRTYVSLGFREFQVFDEDNVAMTREQCADRISKIISGKHHPSSDLSLDFAMRPGAAMKLNKQARYASGEVSNYLSIMQGAIGSLLAKGDAANYNPKDVSLVKIDRAGALATILEGLVALLFILAPLLVLNAAILIAGNDMFLWGMFGVVALIFVSGWTGVGLFGAALMVVSKVARAIIGAPLFDAFKDPTHNRVRVRSMSGKWTTIVETHSEVIATETYNLISTDIHRTGE